MIVRKFAALALLVALAVPVSARPKGSDSVVKATATSKTDAAGKETVTITLTITDPKYHLYANPVGNPDFESNQVVVSLKNGVASKIIYPAGKVKEDKIVGNYKIYKGTATITAVVKRAKATDPLAVEIKVAACDDKSCLVPATIKLSVK
jgi:DsbC/DsbD-like thiol-disulfide interchange protein